MGRYRIKKGRNAFSARPLVLHACVYQFRRNANTLSPSVVPSEP